MDSGLRRNDDGDTSKGVVITYFPSLKTYAAFIVKDEIKMLREAFLL
jgi:hypothetical protein